MVARVLGETPRGETKFRSVCQIYLWFQGWSEIVEKVETIFQSYVKCFYFDIFNATNTTCAPSKLCSDDSFNEATDIDIKYSNFSDMTMSLYFT